MVRVPGPPTTMPSTVEASASMGDPGNTRWLKM